MTDRERLQRIQAAVIQVRPSDRCGLVPPTVTLLAEDRDWLLAHLDLETAPADATGPARLSPRSRTVARR
jgi:hypothetical protein